MLKKILCFPLQYLSVVIPGAAWSAFRQQTTAQQLFFLLAS